ncbi:MAG: hypothetical protein EAX96_03500 [Candidatus Lokiarchaeota archaeon]|nr:hypothetical protein [Candidatus Lokiarchaeota archaeon]
MSNSFKCTRCDWEGSDLNQVVICPNCDVGHSPQWRLKKKGSIWECQNCYWRGPEDKTVKESECPKCHNEYLKKLGE